jgi:lipid II:glycine glycyltransferase (peptidoglycan interpeptide bridge formation enzyme)
MVCPSPFRALVEPAQVLQLGRPFDQIWAGFKPSARNKIRKAEKAGVTVRIASSEADFVAYHEMLTECSRRWATPAGFGRGFFIGLAELGPETVQMWIAEHESQIVAGDLNFLYGDTIMNWGNVSRPQARSLAPNNLLHARAIKWGVERGLAGYNLGSSRGLPGVGSFKASFGTETVDLVRLSLEKPWYRIAKAGCRRARGDAHP